MKIIEYFFADKEHPSDYKTDIKIIAWGSLVMLVIISLVGYFKNYLDKFWLLAVFALFFFLYILFLKIIGLRNHHSIHNRKLFQTLTIEGFRKETYGEYRGLIKIINNRTVRIFYDADKIADGILSAGDIVIEISFKPLATNEEESKEKESIIEQLNKKHTKWNKNYKRLINWNKVIIYINSYPWTTAKRINN